MSKILVFADERIEGETKARITRILYKPEWLTPEEKVGGIEVDTIPEPEKKKGKDPILYIDLETQELWYEYVDVPNVLTAEELQNKVQELERAILELSMLLGGGN